MKMEGQVRIPSGCAISIREGKKEFITPKWMHENGSSYPDFYALHMFFN